eukprot:1961295-Pleurochrysis_carterae.AAC.1
MTVIRSLRLLSGHRRRPLAALTLKPSALTASPTRTFAGAAWSPSSDRASAVSCACMCARLSRAAGTPPTARVCAGSMSTPATSGGGSTLSARATPVKSSI